MLRLQLKILLRTLLKDRVYALVSIVGLALGLACSFLMLLFITFELGFDRYHEKAGRVFRLTQESRRGDQVSESAFLPRTLPLDGAFPEVERMARLFTYSWMEQALVARGDRSFFEARFFLADPSLLDIFSFDPVRGDVRSALAAPDGLVLSESAARKYFDTEDPLGQVLSVRNMRKADLRVTAVIRDMPRNSHFHADFIAPLAAGERLFWDNFAERNSFYTYLLLRPGASPSALEEKLPAFLVNSLGPDAAGSALHLQPLTAIHLRQGLTGEIEPGGDPRTVSLFAVLALIILIVAGINFVNLATARSIQRTREVGIKKVAGAKRINLLGQYMAESTLLAFLAFPLAAALAQAGLPLFNGALGTELSLRFSGARLLFGASILVTLATGLASGIFPAVFLAGARPIQVLKGQFRLGRRGGFLRRALVVLQYAASVVLMIGAAVVFSQMRYVRTKDLGFDREQVVVIPLNDYETVRGYDLVKTAFLRSPAVRGVTASQGVPSRIRARHAVWREGLPVGEDVELAVCGVDFDFLSTYGISLDRGRDFGREHGTDEARAYLINETAARSFAWADPVGKGIQLSNRGLLRPAYEPGEVVGVVRDFHFQSLHEPVQPLVLKIQKDRITHAAVRLAPGKVRIGLDFLAAKWQDVFPGRPLAFSFLDAEVDRLYREDLRTGRIFGYATGLSILIAGLGLFGLASFSAVRRTKEIGIRKVLGASVESIVLLLTREFASLVLVANALAWPAGYWLMSRWLLGFAYRTNVDIRVFLAAGALSLLTALASVGFRALQSAQANPVDSLKYE